MWNLKQRKKRKKPRRLVVSRGRGWGSDGEMVERGQEVKKKRNVSGEDFLRPVSGLCILHPNVPHSYIKKGHASVPPGLPGGPSNKLRSV